MGRIANDIVDEFVDENIKIDSKKSKSLIKIIISIAITLIGLAFTIGQFRSTIVNEMNSFNTSLNTQTTSIEKLEEKINNGFENVDKRIDKVYTDGLDAFDNYQKFNKEQLILVLDYGQENKEMLKRMLELNSTKNRSDVEAQIERAKNNDELKFESEAQIVAIPIKAKVPDYMELNYSLNNGDTTFYLIGATLEYINKLENSKYIIDDIKKNDKYADVYDVIYRNK